LEMSVHQVDRSGDASTSVLKLVSGLKALYKEGFDSPPNTTPYRGGSDRVRLMINHANIKAPLVS